MLGGSKNYRMSIKIGSGGYQNMLGTEFEGCGSEIGFVFLHLKRANVTKLKQIVKGVDKDDIFTGKFFDKDCYMFLLTELKEVTEDKDFSGAMKGGSPYQWKIFIWKGAKASLIQFGFAGTKAADLQNKLVENGNFHDCKIIKERQGSESEDFKNLFGGTISAESGNRIKAGVKSKGAEVERNPRLYEVNQDKLRRIPIRLDCLRDDRNYLLDIGTKVFSHSGPKCGRVETAFTQEMARRRCKADYRKRVKPTYVLGRDKKAMKQFREAIKANEQPKWESWSNQYDPILLKVSKATGQLETVAEAERENDEKLFLFDADMLKRNTIFVLDCHGEIYLWVGKGSSSAEVNEVRLMVDDLLRLPGRPKYIQVEVLRQNMETIYFKERFFGFDQTDLVEVGGAMRNIKNEKEFLIYSKPTGPKQKRVSGELRRVVQFMNEREVDFDKVQDLHLAKDESAVLIAFAFDQVGNMKKLAEGDFGYFETTKMYTYIYSCKNETMHYVFTWEGEHASVRAKTVAGISTTGKDIPGVTEAIMGTKVFKFVSQGREPRLLSFLLEKRKQNILIKQAIPTEKMRNEGKVQQMFIDEKHRKIIAFEINEVGSFGARTCEIPFDSLKRNGFCQKCCYVIYRGSQKKQTLLHSSMGHFQVTDVFTFTGNLATEATVNLLGQVSENTVMPLRLGFQEFITLESHTIDLCKKENTKYLAPSELDLSVNEEQLLPEANRAIRLIRVSHLLKKTGSMFIHDVGDGAYSQVDLLESECYILDTGSTEIYLWIGTKCSNPQVELGIEAATRYISRMLKKRDSDAADNVELVLVDAGCEPLAFKCCFYGWKNFTKGKQSLVRVFKSKIPEYYELAARDDKKRRKEEENTKLKSRRNNLTAFKASQTLRRSRMKTIQRGRIVSFKKKVNELSMLEKVGDRVEVDDITKTITVVRIGKPLTILQKGQTIDELCKSLTKGQQDWLLFQYNNPKEIQFVEKGENGAVELMSCIVSHMTFDKEGEDTGDNAFYAVLKVSAKDLDTNLTRTDRNLLITFVPETTNPILRAAVNSHKKFIFEMLGPFSGETTVRTVEAFDQKTAINLVSKGR